jgi:phosphatidylserine decarboxylase
MTIHKEGFPTLAISFIFFAIINAILYYFKLHQIILILSLIVTLGVWLFLVSFFRVPARNYKSNNINDVISPADGTVVTIEETEETEYFKDKRIQISVFMSPLNVHVNRYPIEGKVKYAKYHPGKYLVAWHPKSSTENERTTIVVENNKNSILFRQIAGALARRIVMYSKENDEVKQSQQCGFIKFGSRVDIFLPVGTKINVTINEKVQGGITSLASV